ncbi:hypothetical protein CCACVL1_29546 [Corchorus capsularis]|uniref:Uncharacterized protein n=1 Tax=Corchorus capsularis TaxID=210143 RepID=A0A1R3G1B2_COCAP|nr:hypothetical protein CCACVL1_29546 [Corchorus capsularis]
MTTRRTRSVAAIVTARVELKTGPLIV